jgi:DegV family protein with EDD domain
MTSDNPGNSSDSEPLQIQRKSAVAVVTDSATALPVDMALANGIHVAQMEVTFNGKTFADGPDGLLDDFYSLLRTSDTMPTTSAPKPGAWLDTFKAASEQSDRVFCVTLSSALSAAYDAACVAAELKSLIPGLRQDPKR